MCNWGLLFKVVFEGDVQDLALQESEVESVRWMDRRELGCDLRTRLEHAREGDDNLRQFMTIYDKLRQL